MKAMISGHRPAKLGGYGSSLIQHDVRAWMRAQIAELRTEDPELVGITGMALGVDTWWGEECLAAGVPIHAYVPFAGQENAWPAASQITYMDILRRAQTVITVCEGGYAAWKMQRRNEAMVEAAQVHLAVWDGTPGGTANCVQAMRARGIAPRFFPFPSIDPTQIDTSNEDARRRVFLAHFDHAIRSHVVNLFLEAIRALHGRTGYEPTLICRSVMTTLKERGDAEAGSAPAVLPDVMRQNREEAIRFASWCLTWETYSPEEKTAIKARGYPTLSVRRIVP